MIPKFKAFLKDTNQVLDVEIIFFELCIVKLTNNEFYEFEDIILMQSTGLYDSTKFEDLSEEEQEEWLESGKTADEWQGREIFEGDIVEYLDGEFSYRGVVEKNTVTNWYVKDIFYEEIYEFTGIADYNDKTCLFKVIGNVHQHHELLEDV